MCTANLLARQSCKNTCMPGPRVLFISSNMHSPRCQQQQSYACGLCNSLHYTLADVPVMGAAGQLRMIQILKKAHCSVGPPQGGQGSWYSCIVHQALSLGRHDPIPQGSDTIIDQPNMLGNGGTRPQPQVADFLAHMPLMRLLTAFGGDVMRSCRCAVVTVGIDLIAFFDFRVHYHGVSLLCQRQVQYTGRLRLPFSLDAICSIESPQICHRHQASSRHMPAHLENKSPLMPLHFSKLTPDLTFRHQSKMSQHGWDVWYLSKRCSCFFRSSSSSGGSSNISITISLQQC